MLPLLLGAPTPQQAHVGRVLVQRAQPWLGRARRGRAPPWQWCSATTLSGSCTRTGQASGEQPKARQWPMCGQGRDGLMNGSVRARTGMAGSPVDRSQHRLPGDGRDRGHAESANTETCTMGQDANRASNGGPEMPSAEAQAFAGVREASRHLKLLVISKSAIGTCQSTQRSCRPGLVRLPLIMATGMSACRA